MKDAGGERIHVHLAVFKFAKQFVAGDFQFVGRIGRRFGRINFAEGFTHSFTGHAWYLAKRSGIGR